MREGEERSDELNVSARQHAVASLQPALTLPCSLDPCDHFPEELSAHPLSHTAILHPQDDPLDCLLYLPQ